MNDTVSNAPFGKPEALPEAGEADDDPVEASEQMAEAAEEESSEELDAPHEGCPKPWLEITVLDDALEPMSSVPVKVDLPSLQTETTLDGQGFKHFDDIEEAAVTVKLLREIDSSGAKTFSVEIVAKESQPEAEVDPEEDVDLDIVEPPLDPY